MKQIKKLMMLTAILAGATTIALAQSDQPGQPVSTYNYSEKKGELKVNVFYNYSLPTGGFKSELINKNSPRGFSADVLYWFKPEWGVGGSFGYQDYYQKNGRDLYKLSDGSDISAVLTNSLQVIPVMAKAIYSPLASKGTLIQPYISAGTGINFINYSQYLGEFSSTSNTSAKFTAEAGAGLKIPFGKNKNAGVLVGAKYHFSPYNKYDIKNLNSINLQAGLQFRLK